MKTSQYLAFVLIASVSAAQAAACSSEFRSCEASRSCAPSGSDAGEGGVDSGGTSSAGANSGGAGSTVVGGGGGLIGSSGEPGGGNAGNLGAGGGPESAAGDSGMLGMAGAPADACLGQICNAPPVSDCESATSFKTYDAVGSCAQGSCSYASRSIPCTCKNHACSTDPCIGVTCTVPPAAICKTANTLTQYATSGTCSAGSCSYQATDTACSGATPKCTAVGGAPRCVGCVQDADCGASTRCNLATNTCNPSDCIDAAVAIPFDSSYPGQCCSTPTATGFLVQNPVAPAYMACKLADLAALKLATADSAAASFPASNTTDADLLTIWKAADTAANHNVTIDLGAITAITGVMLKFESTGAYGYKVETSTTNSLWALKQTGTSTPTTAFTDVSFSTSSVRWIRVTLTSVPAGMSAALASIRVYK